MGERYDVVRYGRLANNPSGSAISAEGFGLKAAQTLGNCTSATQSLSHTPLLAFDIPIEVLV